MFIETPHAIPQRSASFTPRGSKSASSRKTKHRSLTESFCRYYRDLLEKTTENELELSVQPIEEMPKPLPKSNENRQKSALTKGQEIYLLGKYNVNE